MTNLAETTWIAYAWPKEKGKAGTRVFCATYTGDIHVSENGKAGWEGRSRPVRPDAAFLGAGITSRMALGTAGRDGDLWRRIR